MKFSLFLMCFSSLGATCNFNIVPDNKPFMYFDGSEWRTVKNNRYSSNKPIVTPQSNNTVNIKISEILPENYKNTSVFSSISFKDYGIHRRAIDSDEFKTTTEHSVPEVEDTYIIINQLLDLIEKRYNGTKEKSRSASLMTNPRAWIKLISELSNALREIADKTNASYYNLTQESTPKYIIEPWRRVNQNRRDTSGLYGLIELFSDEYLTPERLPKSRILNENASNNKAIQIWNKLPEEIKSASSLRKFKKLLKEHYKHHSEI